MSYRSSSVLLVAFLLLTSPGYAKPKATFLRGTKHTCTAKLASGQPYEVQYRDYHWNRNGSDVYTGAVAYYLEGSGEFLWWGASFTRDGYFQYGRNAKTDLKPDCKAPRRDLLELRDGELADFFALNASIQVLHSNLRFSSIEKGWKYVAEHPGETSGSLGGKWFSSVSLYKELGDDFFRPERLRFDARPYVYDSLAGVKKVGSVWQVEIKGADEPNRAVVVLDSNFKLVKVTRTVVSKVP